MAKNDKPEPFSDSDQAWFDRLRQGAGGAAQNQAEREADVLQHALKRDREAMQADPAIAEATSEAARQHRWQQLQFRLRRAEVAQLRWWQRPNSWAWALAASVFVSVVLVRPLSVEAPIYDEPPTLRGGELELHQVTVADPRRAAETLANELKQAGQPAALHQRKKVFTVDVPVAADTPVSALTILRRTGAKAANGITRIEYAPPDR
jgi:hypothetical protein